MAWRRHTGETKTIAADTVVLAMGTHSQEASVLPGRRTERHSGGRSAEMPGRIAGATRMALKAWGFEAE